MFVDAPKLITGNRVLVIEDGPTLTHGEMKYGAGVVAARKWGAAEIVDPRPWIRGTLKDTFATYPGSATCSRRWATAKSRHVTWRRQSTPPMSMRS